MKFITIIFSVAAIFVAGINAGSPLEPNVCEVVAQVNYEFTSFTSNLLRLYILNLPRSDDSSSDEKLDRLVAIVERSADVPQEDKKIMHDLVNNKDEFEGRSLADQLTHANIWNCLVSIFTGSLNGVLAP